MIKIYLILVDRRSRPSASGLDPETVHVDPQLF